MPSLPGAGASASDMGASIMPGIGGTTTAMVDSMAVFGPSTGDTLYLANANGFTRTSSTFPGQCSPGLLGLPFLASCPDWLDATPNDCARRDATVLAISPWTENMSPSCRSYFSDHI